MTRPLALALLACASLTAQSLSIHIPATVHTGDPVDILVERDGRPAAGVELRIESPSDVRATVTARSLLVKSGSRTQAVYRNETLPLLASTPEGTCDLALANGTHGLVNCDSLTFKPWGQPLGITDSQGRFHTADLTLVPGTVTLVASSARATVHVLPLEYDRRETIAPGIVYRERRWIAADHDGPFLMQILEVDPAKVRVQPARAHDRAATKETTSSMAARLHAIAAVNAGYFVVNGTYAGASDGVYQLNREVLSGGPTGRSALVFCDSGTAIDFVNFHGSITAGADTLPLAGVNREVGANEAVLFRPVFGPRTLTPAGTLEVLLDANGKVTAVAQGDSAIPPNGSVLAASGTAAGWLRERAQPGAALTTRTSLDPAGPTCPPVHIIGAGPRLVAAGAPVRNDEKFNHREARHPRTAFATTAGGTWLFITLDGRQPASAGMRLGEFAAELVSLGAVDAINLDGGGSTVMVTSGRIRNTPSDGTERPVSDALLLFSKP